MRYLKLYENFNEKSIHEICKKYNIKNYTINKDGSIDVDGDVDLYRNNLIELPLIFRNVNGDFNCDYNKLTSLKGCPESVSGDFECSNNQLTSLEYFPKSCGYFWCNNNIISDFKYFIEPIIFFYCDNNTVHNIWKLFKNKSYVELLNDYDCIRGNDIVIDRFNEFLEEIDKPTVQSVKGYNNI